MSKKTETTNYNIKQIDNGYIVDHTKWETDSSWNSDSDYIRQKSYCKDWAEVITFMINNPFVDAPK